MLPDSGIVHIVLHISTIQHNISTHHNVNEGKQTLSHLLSYCWCCILPLDWMRQRLAFQLHVFLL